jgi:hypothetical protein
VAGHATRADPPLAQRRARRRLLVAHMEGEVFNRATIADPADAEQFLLVTRGCHRVQERPFNRSPRRETSRYIKAQDPNLVISGAPPPTTVFAI